jgi:hypothetical protein
MEFLLMNAVNHSSFSDRTTRRMTDFLLTTVAGDGGKGVEASMPAGAVHLPFKQLVLASTPCRKGVFTEAMVSVAKATGADVLLAHQGRYPVPEILDTVTFSAVLRGKDTHVLLEDMVLFWSLEEGYWLLPSAKGIYIALEPAGLRASLAAPYEDFWERTAGITEAAKRIIRATRTGEAL